MLKNMAPEHKDSTVSFFDLSLDLAFRFPIEAIRARFCDDRGADPVRSGPWAFEGRELGQPPAQNRAQADGARFFWSLFFAGPKKSDPGPGRSAWSG